MIEAAVILEFGANNKLLRILAELEKPIPKPSIFVEGFVNPLSCYKQRYEVEKNKYSISTNIKLLKTYLNQGFILLT